MPRPKVLIVDDDANSRTVLCDALSCESYTLLEACNGEQALETANRELPDLILLDIMMPGMDGDLVLHKLKQQRQTCSIPVIMITALSKDVQISACLNDGAMDYICKPFSNLVMRARVFAALCTRSLHSGNRPSSRQEEERSSASLTSTAEAVTAAGEIAAIEKESYPARPAPAGSNWSGRGGDKSLEALDGRDA
jgi:DNA-binding response OmpR family regulator